MFIKQIRADLSIWFIHLGLKLCPFPRLRQGLKKAMSLEVTKVLNNES